MAARGMLSHAGAWLCSRLAPRRAGDVGARRDPHPAHRAHLQLVDLYFRERFFLNFDWEMMTYWALVAFVHALDYHRESQERELTAAQLQTQLAEAQLEALQRQLHPHFLFNTLNTISALMHRDVHAADEMLVQLSDLLRLTLDRVGTQQVPLTDEVDFLRKYLEIEQTRFGDRLQVNIDVDPKVLDAPVPNLDSAAARRERPASRHRAASRRAAAWT